MKAIIRGLLNRLGYDVKKFVSDVGKPIDVLDLAVRSAVASTDRFFVLQIGANDGKMDDPVYPIFKRYKLHGLLVEPMPEYFALLRVNYADQPQLMFENCAISTENGEKDLFRIKRDIYSDPGFNGMASFDRLRPMQAKRILPNLDRNIEVIRVRTMTLAALLSKYNIKRVDLLQIDTEGFDYEILRMAVDINILPAIINYEHINLCLQDQISCRRMLSAHNYKFANNGPDTLAIRDL